MPIYEFRCAGCGRVFEMIFKTSDDQVELACPDCKATTVERVVSVTNHTVGIASGEKQARLDTKSCGPGNSCTTLELPGHSR
ncbi:MAG: FmdB family zinc ribbon protein [Thermodesulfobacteriota bacterium]